ncbi:PilC/PilY family type IV pilus protein [Thalassotalea sp. G2M2-11]|uniref:pilus assembly protein n=1 Tax=Thalassotalea sp. G2M2-11 TaxID=2787627 RepID=UPI0019D04BD2|nr:PilC/PilY family type IV pilus protein [Thalassotalea sp. G2M2-11]
MKKLIALTILLLTSNISFSEDIELYISETIRTTGKKPQVLIILDNSASMSTFQNTVEGYKNDPSAPYVAEKSTHAFDDGMLYYNVGGADGGGFGVPDSASDARRFPVDSNNCETARQVIADVGYYIGRIREYRMKGNTGTWEEVPENNGANIEVLDCMADNELDLADAYNRAENPITKTNNLPNGYPIDKKGNKSNPVYYSDDVTESEKIDWQGGRLVTIYSANYLRWHYLESKSEVSKTRLKMAQDSISEVIKAAPSVDFGLEVFNYNPSDNASASQGGRVVSAVKEMNATNKAALLDIINNKLAAETNTPLCESLYEASQYLAGNDVEFGDTDKDYKDNLANIDYKANRPPIDSAALIDSNTYSSPMQKCHKTAYIILITDGAPTFDIEANDLVAALADDESEKPDDYDRSVFDGSYMPSLAAWMANNDVNPQIEGRQTAHTYTIGFGVPTEKEGEFTAEPLLNETANRGNGIYYRATEQQELTEKLLAIFEDLTPSNQSLTSASVAANNFDRTETLDSVYYAMFDPDNSPRWQGNVKKYKVVGGTQYGKNDQPALNEATGHFSDDVRSYWTPDVGEPDGAYVESGGVAEILRSTAVADRVLYSDLGTDNAIVKFTTANALLAFGNSTNLANELNVIDDDTEITNMLNWAKGMDVDDDNGDKITTDTRYDIFADPLHSKPLVVNYGSSIRIVIGTNAGALHMFQDNDDTVDETWAFMPKEFFSNYKSLRENNVGSGKVYGVDGKITPFVLDKNGDTKIVAADGDKLWIFFGLRRGGSTYYALDITNPDAAPKLMWKIDANTSGFSELGQSWSQPKVTYSKLNASGSGETAVAKPVVIFGGGYDGNKDASGPGTADAKGRAIYMVDAEKGTLLWSAAPSGATTTFSGIDDSIPSSIGTLDSNGDGFADRLYTGDTGGNVWRVDMPGKIPNDPTEPWTIYKLADLGGTTDSTDVRFFNEASIVRTFITETLETTVSDGSGGSKTVVTLQEKPYDAILIGSGDRSNPLGRDTQDTFFMIKDENVVTKSTATAPAAITKADLYDYTDDPFGATMTDEQRQTLSIAVSKKSGWFIDFTQSGEKNSSKAIAINGVAYFTSYTPPDLTGVIEACEVPSGAGWLYAVDLALGIKKYDWQAEDPDNRSDRIAYISEQFLGSPTLIVVPEDDGDPNTVDESVGNIIVGRKIMPVGFSLKTLRNYLYVEEEQ